MSVFKGNKVAETVLQKTSHHSLKLSCVALAISQAVMLSAQAANIVVNDTGDIDAEDNNCTLREAIRSANSDNANSSGCIAGNGADEITFALPPSKYEVTLSQGSPLELYSNMSAEGPLLANGQKITINANSESGVMDISSGAAVTLRRLTLSNGRVNSGSGAGLYVRGDQTSLTIENSNVINNYAEGENIQGGGISIRPGASVTIQNSQLYNNYAGGRGGAIAIANNGHLTIDSSSLVNNSAGSRGSGIHVYGSAFISNSTISGNSAPSGGGVRGSSDALINIDNSTIVGNLASGYGGGVIARFNSIINISNSIVSGNRSSGLNREEIVASSDGTINFLNSNVLGDSSITNAQLADFTVSGLSNVIVTSDGNQGQGISLDEIVQPLSKYGTYSATHIPSQGSPAVGNGNTTICGTAPVGGVDQRGVPRGVAECDIGAVEFTTATLIVDSATDESGGANCTLRDAILSVNQRKAVGGCDLGGDETTINFEPSVFPGSVNNMVSLATGLPPIVNASLTINGRGKPGLNINASGIPEDEEQYAVLTARAADVTLNNLVISGGDSSGIKAEGSVVTINNSTVRNNYANSYGGGLYASSSQLFVNNSTISGNSSGNIAGGIDLFSSSFLELVNSTVSNNTAANTGGGIQLEGDNNTAVIINSTVSQNVASPEVSGGSGGGIHALAGNAHDLTISNSIISGNYAGLANEDNDAEVYLNSDTTFVFDKSNIFGSSALNDAFSFGLNFVMPTGSDINASSDGLNIPLSSIIKPLANNGGPTFTHALASNSPALDAGDIALCLDAGINVDQRGTNRSDGKCDIGAFEFEDQTCYVVKASNNKVLAFCL